MQKGTHIKNGINYSGASVNNEIIYSTVEHKIGKWIDGNDLFEITFETDMPQVTTEGETANVDIPFPNVFVRYLEGTFYTDPTGTGTFSIHTIPYTNETLAANGKVKLVRVSQYNDNIRLASSHPTFNNRKASITVRYTKYVRDV